MDAIKIKVNEEHCLEDLETPISIYMKLKNLYPDAVLLESSDYDSAAHSVSYIAVEPIGAFLVKDGQVSMTLPDGQCETRQVGCVADGQRDAVSVAFEEYMNAIEISQEDKMKGVNGLFGYCAFEAVKYFEDVRIASQRRMEDDMPEIKYTMYRYVIALNHYRKELKILENVMEGEISRISDLRQRIAETKVGLARFEKVGEESADMADDDYKEMVRNGKKSCQRGDVFQIVLSRRFSQGFRGDDLTLYRTLRSVNPSPYLFFFDYGAYHIFGSSPEVHLRVEDGMARILPIAGTYRRTGKKQEDEELAKRLCEDEKEGAEHVMLVDLARNDLSRNTEHVRVESFKTVQYYSHVLHLVSSVVGQVGANTNVMRLFAETFPAGTLSGAPKVSALRLIDRYEGKSRGFYGGCIGIFGFDGSVNQAITIRSFLSRGNRLYYQAGAGIVAKSTEEGETQEVNNKLGALRQAIDLASKV